MNKKLREIMNHYGINNQLKYFQSEVFELNEAIIKYQESLRNPMDIISNVFKSAFAVIKERSCVKATDSIKEEIADVMVMLKQIQLYYNISTNEIKEVMKSKVERQIERINE